MFFHGGEGWGEGEYQSASLGIGSVHWGLMGNIFFILLIVFLILTVIVLAVGVIGMGKGGEFNARYGNKLMRLRILCQLGAIASFVLYLLTMGGN